MSDPQSTAANDRPAFAELDRNSDLLLNVLRAFSADQIPLLLLHRGFSPQRRWNASGESEERVPRDSGVPDELGCFLDRPYLDRALAVLQERAEIDNDGKNIVVMRATVGSQHWHAACALVCHAFPRGPLLDALHQEHAIPLLQPLTSLLSVGRRDWIDRSGNKEDLASTLLNALPLDRRDREVTDSRPVAHTLQKTLDNLLQGLPHGYLHLWAARATLPDAQVSLEKRAEWWESFQRTYGQLLTKRDNRVNAHLGSLQARDLILRFRSNWNIAPEGQSTRDWAPNDPRCPSPLEMHAAVRLAIGQARSLQALGDNAAAKERVLQCMNKPIPLDMRVEYANVCTDLASDPAFLAAIPSSTLNDCVDLAAALYLASGEQQYAAGEFEAALAQFENTQRRSTGMRLFRAQFGIARCTHRLRQKVQATRRWKDALAMMETAGWSQGYAYALVQRSIAVLEGDELRDRGASAILAKSPPKWLIGGEEWLEWLDRSIVDGVLDMDCDVGRPTT